MKAIADFEISLALGWQPNETESNWLKTARAFLTPLLRHNAKTLQSQREKRMIGSVFEALEFCQKRQHENLKMGLAWSSFKLKRKEKKDYKRCVNYCEIKSKNSSIKIHCWHFLAVHLTFKAKRNQCFKEACKSSYICILVENRLFIYFFIYLFFLRFLSLCRPFRKNIVNSSLVSYTENWGGN